MCELERSNINIPLTRWVIIMIAIAIAMIWLKKKTDELFWVICSKTNQNIFVQFPDSSNCVRTFFWKCMENIPGWKVCQASKVENVFKNKLCLLWVQMIRFKTLPNILPKFKPRQSTFETLLTVLYTRY